MYLLSAPSLAFCLLSFSLSLSCSASPSFSHNCLWSVPSEYQCAAVSLETVRTERQAGYSEGVSMMLALLANVLLISTCVYVCSCMAHVQKCVSEVLNYYLCELDEIHPTIVCFPCTCLRGSAGWMPAAPPQPCQAPLSCSWLSSQALCCVSQLRNAS